jgi:hypothetical protein
MNLSADRINYLNIALMLVSCVISFIIPFELFLFSYGVLGPLHYLTEIGWLHKKNYFTKGKYDFIFLTILCCILFYYSYLAIGKKMTGEFFASLVALGVFLSLIFVFV